ncbi:2-oxo acid dehydrogenase subunit E2 [Streptomyces sp. NTH33]|uniref:2-oxo acid dehydrogenase subunit E2 n=1 Tax=Streptomyces sp. NTH33 TaxID=1735453 RepID=UPI000DAA9BD5|nr:2-oxo acid dehydrogenase subunit E2 [Streptomyces sp. NTH33]
MGEFTMPSLGADMEAGTLQEWLVSPGDTVTRGEVIAGGTLTVSSLGDQGVEAVYGVIYPPQGALVGFGAVLERPWADHGMLGVRPVVTATLSADHRASDGAVGARFLNAVDRLLQKPENL